MKKLLFIALMLAASVAIAQEAIVWYNVQSTINCSWDVVTTDVEGYPIVGCTYQLVYANADITNSKAAPVVAMATDQTFGTVTLPKKGRYFIGVKAIHESMSSVINWADEPLYQEVVSEWGVRWGVAPKPPKNVKP